MSSWNPFSYPPRAVLKSVWGFILPVLAVLANTLQNDEPITWRSLVAALISGLLTGYGVFAVKNDPPGEVTPAEAGNIGVLFLIAIVLIVLGILGLVGILGLGTVLSIVLLVIGVLLALYARSGGTRF